METSETINPEYLKGFNQGYLIAQHIPDLAAQLSTAEGQTRFLEGFKDGSNEYSKEISKAWKPSWLSNDRNKNASPGQGKNIEKDIDLEPE